MLLSFSNQCLPEVWFIVVSVWGSSMVYFILYYFYFIYFLFCLYFVFIWLFGYLIICLLFVFFACLLMTKQYDINILRLIDKFEPSNVFSFFFCNWTWSFSFSFFLFSLQILRLCWNRFTRQLCGGFLFFVSFSPSFMLNNSDRKFLHLGHYTVLGIKPSLCLYSVVCYSTFKILTSLLFIDHAFRGVIASW